MWKANNKLSTFSLITGGENTGRIFMKILPEMHLWTRKSPLNFGSHPDSGLGPDPPWQRSTLSVLFLPYGSYGYGNWGKCLCFLTYFSCVVGIL